ncbi:MAG: cytochrome c biogenesis protein CcsA [Acidobacteria bacterium]|nr:cytochrome c biogenesis protein CcsA [Acidobacteriota bacterium]
MPKSTAQTSDKLTPVLGVTAAAMLVAALYMIFLWVPNESTMGVVQRIFYFHVPSAATSWVAFFVGGVAAVRYLVSRDPRLDDLSVACNETGLVFCIVNLVTGAFWAKPIWGIWWAWDARGTSAMLLAVIYIGYLILRQSVDEPSQRAVVCAVVSICGMVDIPIIYMANRWWRTQHPAPVIGGGGLDANMGMVLGFATLALLTLLWYIVRQRRKLAEMQRETEGLRQMIHALAG